MIRTLVLATFMLAFAGLAAAQTSVSARQVFGFDCGVENWRAARAQAVEQDALVFGELRDARLDHGLGGVIEVVDCVGRSSTRIIEPTQRGAERSANQPSNHPIAIWHERTITQVPAVTPEWHERIVHTLIGASMVAHACDLASTEFGIGTGQLRESNPIMRWATDRGPIPAGLAKGALAVGSAYALLKLHKSHPKWALVLSAASTAGIGYVAYSNGRLLK